VKSKCLIIEMIGATNWWLDKHGRAQMVFGGHAELAQKITGVRFIQYGADDKRGWTLQGQAYEQMYRAGWVRISYKAPEHRIQIEFRGSISPKAMEWLQDAAFERQAVVVDDHGRIYADFRPEDQQGGVERRRWSESIVEMLLNETDSKELAMRPMMPEDGAVVWFKTTDEEVPVGLGADGFFYYDAAYTLAGKVDRDDYDAITAGILSELEAGKEKGEILGIAWELRPHSVYDPPY
jgi:hypothetical protein